MGLKIQFSYEGKDIAGDVYAEAFNLLWEMADQADQDKLLTALVKAGYKVLERCEKEKNSDEH